MTLLEHLCDNWQAVLHDEFERPYWGELETFVNQQRADYPGRIYPSTENVFAALNLLPPAKVRVVLLGQDPYHGPGQAHGLSFSVLPDVKHPPSLRNIFKELHTDIGCQIPVHGVLTRWAHQGVLLLNAVLTVRHKEANSHRKRGWESFTDAVIHCLANQNRPLVFILWGAAAQKKAAFVDRERHVVIESVHPSPLSAHNGFFGSRPFSTANTALKEFGHAEIDWCCGD